MNRRAEHATVIVAAIATARALHAAQWFFIPALLGFALASVLLPVVRWLTRVHVPAPIGASVAVVASCASILIVAVVLEPPLRELAEQVPQSITAGRLKLAAMGEPYRRMARIGLSQTEADRLVRRATSPRVFLRPP